MEPLYTSGAEGFVTSLYSEGGSILSIEPRMCLLHLEPGVAQKGMCYLAPTPVLRAGRSGEWVHAPIQCLLLILLSSKQESLWIWLLKLCPALSFCSLLSMRGGIWLGQNIAEGMGARTRDGGAVFSGQWDHTGHSPPHV